MPLYTKTGDAGETGLFDGTRVSKADARVDAYGEVDELNAHLGLARAHGVDAEIDGVLLQLQRDLFALGARLADPAQRIAARVHKATVGPGDIARLEAWIDRFDAETPPLRRFILAGGTASGAALHLARTVCRRAERRIVALAVRGETPASIETDDAPGPPPHRAKHARRGPRSQGATRENIQPYLTEEQRREAGCNVGRMPAEFHHGLPGAEAIEPDVLIYVNRLSDLLFALARVVNHRAGHGEVEW